MADGTIHIVGAGLAGLSTAVRLAGRGRRVVLHEATRFSGGRARPSAPPRLGPQDHYTIGRGAPVRPHYIDSPRVNGNPE